MTVRRRTKNSKKIFFGGMGSLIPLRRSTKPASQNGSESQPTASAWDETEKQIFKEADEQFNSPSSPTEASTSRVSNLSDKEE